MNAEEAAKVLGAMPAQTRVDAQAGDHVGLVLPPGTLPPHEPAPAPVAITVDAAKMLLDTLPEDALVSVQLSGESVPEAGRIVVATTAEVVAVSAAGDDTAPIPS